LERASDAAFEELNQRELDDEVNGIVTADDPSRRARGGHLTEQNVKLWLSIMNLYQLLSPFFHLIFGDRIRESLPHGSKL
jgi:hypothetical protein